VSCSCEHGRRHERRKYAILFAATILAARKLYRLAPSHARRWGRVCYYYPLRRRFNGMARAAIVLSVLVSSPSDVAAECATVLTAIRDWNSSHSRDLGIVLEPVQWQTHAYPESGDRPQALINKQIVDESDMVVAVFGHRIGTATGAGLSGRPQPFINPTRKPACKSRICRWVFYCLRLSGNR
jgi:hypothetical protein